MFYHAGVDEQEICQCTGHRSNALHEYKVPTVQEQQKLSSILELLMTA